MSDIYTVSVGASSRSEITGGRIGHFVLLPPGSGGPYYLGDSSVDDTTGIALTVEPHVFYVTSPDEVYVYNASGGTSGTLRLFHNR